MIQNKSSVQYGVVRGDGATRVFFNGKPAGWLMPEASETTLEASPGIQGWSHPRGKVSTEMFDSTSVARFADHWERRYRRSYPYASKEV
jgi:hypothetical protein